MEIFIHSLTQKLGKTGGPSGKDRRGVVDDVPYYTFKEDKVEPA